MKAIKVSLAVLFLLLPANASAGENMPQVKTNSQLLGCWKRINLPHMNKSEPYPLEHQWYCFFADGKYSEYHSNKDDSLEENLSLMRALPMQDYSIAAEGVVLIRHY